jgi:hypothetical protein
MDKEDSEKSIWDTIKNVWNSLPNFVRFVGTLLSIVIAIKALLPAAVMEVDHFGANPEVIEPGDTTVLSWGVSGASDIIIEPGIGAVSSNGSLSVSPSQTTTYKLIISGKGENKTASCTVTVKDNSPLITSFESNPDSIKKGESAVLNWHVAGASKVKIEPDIGVVEQTGTSSISPAKTTTYKLTASKEGKEDIAYCTVAVEDNLSSPEEELSSPKENLSSQKNALKTSQSKLSPSQENLSSSQDNPTSPETSQTPGVNSPTINSFNANPDMISKGESSDLTWSVSSATKVSIEPDIGTVGLTGSQRIYPDKNTTYTLTATNEFESVDAKKVVFVKDPTASEASPTASSVQLSTPKQLTPANGMVFDNSTSGTTLEWTAVSGATSYSIEIKSSDLDSDSWLPETAESGVISDVNATSYSLDFPTKSIGTCRWRIWAVGPDGKESKKSAWWNFNYTV